MMIPRYFIISALCLGYGSTVMSDSAPELAATFVEAYCAECHYGDDAEGHIDFEELSFDPGELDVAKLKGIVERVRHHEMPPRDSEQPPLTQRRLFAETVESIVRDEICADGIRPAPAAIRRLSRDEYGNTIRDLLGIHVNVALILPEEGAGGEGFDNAAETLFLSTIHGEKYLDAATTALQHALRDKRTRGPLTLESERAEASPEDRTRASLERFLPKAFRRPVEPEEVTNYVTLFQEHYAEAQSITEAQQLALAAALVSPDFLFRVELPNRQPGPAPLTPHELASRLSYFLWVSMPDDELRKAADNGTLSEPTVLERQVKRMLAGERVGRQENKVRGFAKSFAEQWLGTRALGREFKPDPKVSRSYDSELEGGLQYEPVLFLEDILVNDLSILSLLDADFTYANRHVAKHYQLKGEFREQPKRVELPEGSHRGGVLGMGAVLAVTSHPHRTSPVLRGKWILETLLGTPPPPPPPDVPELEETTGQSTVTSVRERLEMHRGLPACASCHDRIDPLGFGLEHFDVLGRWRYREQGERIDATGKMPDGTEFKGIDGLKRVLLSRKDQFARHLTAKVLGFALGRGLRQQDYCTIDAIVEELKSNDYSSHALILAIVKSPTFLMKAGTDPAIAISGSQLRDPRSPSAPPSPTP